MKKLYVFFVLLTFSLYANADNGFAISEHLAAGAQITVHFADGTKINPTISLPNGLRLNYADIISLGDLYAVVGQPIMKGKSTKEQELRFLAAFSTLAYDEGAVKEAEQLTTVIHGELQDIEKQLAAGMSAEAAYAQTADEVGRKLNCITGGGCSINKWWLKPGRFLQLAMTNSDHFVPFAAHVYQLGHRIALSQAIVAHFSKKTADLQLAYALEAFADHYLSDIFAAGHQRTPRDELAQHVTPTVVGLLLANYMHNEENKIGLHVIDTLGRQWYMFGDFSYFNPKNDLNRMYLHEALQQSVDEVYKAFIEGVMVLPQVALPQVVTANSISPLFYWDKATKTLWRRENLANIRDYHWIKKWWGWSTLLALKNEQGTLPNNQLLWQQAISTRSGEHADLKDMPVSQVGGGAGTLPLG